MKPLAPLGSLGVGESAAGLAGDARALADLKRAAQADPKAAARQVAQQFEALFMNMVMKNMREASPKSELFDSPTRDLAQGMLDQEMAAKMATRGTGLAEMIARQLERQVDPRAGFAAPELEPYAPRRPQAPAIPAIGRPAEVGASTAAAIRAARALAPVDAQAAAPTAKDAKTRQRDFVSRVGGHAQAAEQATGIPAKFIVAQAALESGWGRHEIRDPGTGQATHNLFGIKAGAGWSGRTVDVTTTEYVNGRAEKRVEKFRAYASYSEAFQDYARLLVNNPRYSQVIARGRSADEFAQGLQRAGYATDPQYGAKLAAMIRRTQALRSDA